MKDFFIKTKIRGFDLEFKTKSGVFSKRQVDAGTLLLVECLEITPSDSVLDLACGYGPVGITASRLAPEGNVTLVDANIRAVRLAEENLRLNDVKNAKVILSDGVEAVLNERFDVVASNPPINSGLGIFQEFAGDTKKILSSGGKVYFVSQERLKTAVERLFEEVFGNYQLVKRSRGYIISLARKDIK